MKYTIPAIIFAGGRSSRMGKDKALLPFGTAKSLSEFQYLRLATLFEEVYLCAKEAKFDFSAPVILDRYTESSPLVGLVSVFETLQADEVFILSVDAPFVDEATIKKLLQCTQPGDAIIAKTPSGTQPLCGLYRRSILPLAKTYLNKGMHRLNHLLQTSQTHYVTFPDDSLFFNLNHPHEYEQALLDLT